MIMCSVLISYCVCRRPSWTPKTQPNGSSAVVWLSFWCSTRFTRKKLDQSRGTYLYIVVPYRHLTFLREHFFIRDYFWGNTFLLENTWGRRLKRGEHYEENIFWGASTLKRTFFRMCWTLYTQCTFILLLRIKWNLGKCAMWDNHYIHGFPR